MKVFMTSRGVATPVPRRGVTLSEVLVSTFVMSIGVVSLATLFPIALLRSVQATQLTNATLLRQNAQALIESAPVLIHDPDGDNNQLEHRPDIDLNNDGDTADTGEIDRNGNGQFDSGAYLVDPLGVVLSPSPNSLGLLPRFFGTNNASPTLTDAESLCMLPDTWEPVVSSRVTSQNNTTFRVTLNGDVDYTDLTTSQIRNTANPNNPLYRMVLFDVTGKNAAIKDLLQVDTANDQLIWQDTTGGPALALPAGFTAFTANVEVQIQRYTWLLTVRKNEDGTAAIDVATFFDRSFRAEDEFVYGDPSNASTSVAYSINLRTGVSLSSGYDTQNGIAGVDDDGNGTTDDAPELGWPGSDDNRTFVVNWGAGSDPDPFIKQGGYVLDTVAGTWYRIVQYTENLSAGSASVVVDRDLVPLPSNRTPRLVFFRGVIEVYPLGMRMNP